MKTVRYLYLQREEVHEQEQSQVCWDFHFELELWSGQGRCQLQLHGDSEVSDICKPIFIIRLHCSRHLLVLTDRGVAKDKATDFLPAANKLMPCGVSH